MKNVRNYIVRLMDGTDEKVTLEQATAIVKAWSQGAKVCTVNGGAFALHQIKSIQRVEPSMEYFELLKAGEVEGGHGWPIIDDKTRKEFNEIHKKLGMGNRNIELQPPEYVENKAKQLGYKDPETGETLYS